MGENMRLTAQKFSDGVLVCASILSGGMLIYSIVDHRDKWLYLESALLKWAFYYVFPFVCLVMFVAAIFFLRSEHKINLSLIIVSTVVVVYSIELILISPIKSGFAGWLYSRITVSPLTGAVENPP